MDMSLSPAQACVLVICGVPATGKSTLAGIAAARLGWPVVSSDRTRKDLAGVAPAEHAGAAHYTAAASEAVYTELGARARASVRAGSVIIDGTFRRREDRAAFTAAFSTAAPALWAECRVPLPVLLARAARRDRQPGQVSDATAAVVARAAAEWEPLEDVSAGLRTVIDTQLPACVSLAGLLSLLAVLPMSYDGTSSLGNRRRCPA